MGVVAPTRPIVFTNGNHALAAQFDRGAEPSAILEALQLEPPRSLLMACGGAARLDEALQHDERLEANVLAFFCDVIAPAALQAGALIIDGGTDAGVMKLMGLANLATDYRLPLVGVVPAGKVTFPGYIEADGFRGRTPLEPNHSHFVLVDTDEWGGETESMFAIAKAVHDGWPENSTPRPTMLLSLHGGGIARREVLRSVRLRWPVVALVGAGGLSDDLYAQSQQPSGDPVLQEIVAHQQLTFLPMDQPAEQSRTLLTRLLTTL